MLLSSKANLIKYYQSYYLWWIQHWYHYYNLIMESALSLFDVNWIESNRIYPNELNEWINTNTSLPFVPFDSYSYRYCTVLHCVAHLAWLSLANNDDSGSCALLIESSSCRSTGCYNICLVRVGIWRTLSAWVLIDQGALLIESICQRIAILFLDAVSFW